MHSSDFRKIFVGKKVINPWNHYKMKIHETEIRKIGDALEKGNSYMKYIKIVEAIEEKKKCIEYRGNVKKLEVELSKGKKPF